MQNAHDQFIKKGWEVLSYNMNMTKIKLQIKVPISINYHGESLDITNINKHEQDEQ